MPENKSRFVTLCQQLLVTGTVLAVAAPAATVVSLDIVGPEAAGPGAPPVSGGSSPGSVVSGAPVDADVREIPIRGVDGESLRTLVPAPAPADGKPAVMLASSEDLAALSAPEPVEGYATVGVTWRTGEIEDEHDITVQVRSLEDGAWSSWQEMEYHDEHAPDPGTAEARNARPGTDPLVVGDVDRVQVKAVTESGEAPAGMKLALVDPGAGGTTAVEEPAIDTAKLASAEVTNDAVLAASKGVTPRPKIYSRAQWGADEGLRGGSPSYYEVHAGFVHHTVNANGYSRAQVPSILRGIYAYHTRGRGWSDIGYNYIVDRFGRIWEGRYGGVDRPVVGAHTSGYNERSFAMSALGNFDITRPSAAMVAAYGRLFAWKLSLHGVDAADRSQDLGSRTFPAVNGHRDAGSTACPGRYLYEKVNRIRNLAAGHQMPWDSRARQASISGVGGADLVARDAVTKKVYLLRTDEGLAFERRRRAADGWRGKDLITPLGDVTGDGRADVMARDGRSKVTAVYPGQADGTFGPAIRSTLRYRYIDQMTGASDLNHDGNVDLVARDGKNENIYLYAGRSDGQFRKRRLMVRDWGWTTMLSGAGELSGDEHLDILVRDRRGRLSVRRGDGRGGLAGRMGLPGRWGGHDIVNGLGDLTGDGVDDILVRNAKSKLTSILPGRDTGGVEAAIGPFSGFRDVSFLAAVGDVTGNSAVDLLGRGSGGNLVVFPSNGAGARSVIDTGATFGSANLVLNVGDWDGDGHGDVMTRSRRTGRLYLYPGDGEGRLGAERRAGSGFGNVRMLAAVGDVTGDGNPDLMGQPSGSAMRIYPGNGGNGFRGSYVAHSAIGGVDQIGAGLWNGDGSPDSIIKQSDGDLVFYPGNGPGGLMGGSRIGGGANRYDVMSGVGDINGDGQPDIVARERGTGELWKLLGSSLRREQIGSGFDRYDLIG